MWFWSRGHITILPGTPRRLPGCLCNWLTIVYYITPTLAEYYVMTKELWPPGFNGRKRWLMLIMRVKSMRWKIFQKKLLRTRETCTAVELWNGKKNLWHIFCIFKFLCVWNLVAQNFLFKTIILVLYSLRRKGVLFETSCYIGFSLKFYWQHCHSCNCWSKKNQKYQILEGFCNLYC